MEQIQQLSLIFVQSLDLYVEDGVRIYQDTVVILDVVTQTDLIVSLDLRQTFLYGVVIGILQQVFQTICILSEARSDQFFDQSIQLGVCLT